MRIECVIAAGWDRANLNEAHRSGNGKGGAGVESLGAFALLGKHCPTGLVLLASYNKDPGQRQQTMGRSYIASLTIGRLQRPAQNSEAG